MTAHEAPLGAAGAARPSQGIYLHFLDRELLEAAAAMLSADQAATLLRLLAATTAAPLYCGLSGPWENERFAGEQMLEIEALFATGQLDLVSHSPSQSEFLDSRREAYEHDAERYPRYYEPARELTWARPTDLKSTGSTGPLIGYLSGWAAQPPPDADYQPLDARLRAPVAEALRHRATQAVTWAFFEPHMADLAGNARARATIRRQISRGFTSDYLRHLDGTIATGIRELHAFDNLARVFPDFHVPLLREMASIAGLNALVDRDESNLDTWSRFLQHRDHDHFRLMAGTISWIIRAMWSAEKQRPMGRAVDPAEFYSNTAITSRMTDLLRRAVPLGERHRLVTTLSPLDQVREACLRLDRCGSTLKAADPTLASLLETTRSQIMPTEVDVVVLVTAPVEFEALRQRLEIAAGGPQPTVYDGPVTYTRYGPIGGATVGLVRSSMGSSGPGGSTLTVADAIRHLEPWAVIAVGIAFGVDEEKSPIGQVLLSQQLAEYERQRVGSGADGALAIIQRGDRTPGSPILLSRFRDSNLDTHGIDVNSGLLLSGEKLIDNPTFKNALLAEFPEAIGGEMEGAGLFAAATRGATHVLVVKAVCDYAAQKSENKDERQATAAAVAADAFMHVLQRGGLTRPADRSPVNFP